MNHLKYYLTLIIAFTLLTIGNFLNAEDINLSDENVVFSLLQGKSFHCLMKETNYNGPVIIEIKSLTKNKFKGVSNEFCFQEIDWSGKFKKNKMKIIQHGASAQTCYCRNGFQSASSLPFRVKTRILPSS